MIRKLGGSRFTGDYSNFHNSEHYDAPMVHATTKNTIASMDETRPKTTLNSQLGTQQSGPYGSAQLSQAIAINLSQNHINSRASSKLVGNKFRTDQTKGGNDYNNEVKQ